MSGIGAAADPVRPFGTNALPAMTASSGSNIRFLTSGIPCGIAISEVLCSRTARSLRVGRVSPGLDLPDPVRPGGADIRQNVPDLVVGQNMAKPRHAALEPGHAPRLHQALAAEFRVVEEQPVVVVPGMASQVMRRRAQDPVRSDAPPVGLTFEFGPVTGSAFPCVEHPSVAEIPAFKLMVCKCHGGKQQQDGCQDVLHRTSTHVFMPDAWRPSVRQCGSHLPGLPNKQSISQLCCGMTIVVSRMD